MPIQEQGNELLKNMKRIQNTLSAEGARIRGGIEDLLQDIVDRRSGVQNRLNTLALRIQNELAGEDEISEYVLLLHERLELDKEYTTLVESAADTELPQDSEQV